MSNDSLSASIGDAVRSQRVAKMWTQKRLAEESGVSRVTIARIETDASTPHMSSVLAIARALGVDPHVLVADPSRAWPAGRQGTIDSNSSSKS